MRAERRGSNEEEREGQGREDGESQLKLRAICGVLWKNNTVEAF